MKRFCIFLSVMICCLNASAQTMFDDPTLAEMFKARIKTMDEFLCRLNNVEHNPGLNLEDKEFHKKNFLALFDYQMKYESKQRLFDDITALFEHVDTLNKTVLIDDPLLFAEAKCVIEYKKQRKEIRLVLQNEKIKDNLYRWCLVGVKDLFGSLGIDDSTKMALSPVENEINFMELDDCINTDYRNILGYYTESRHVDQLSFLMGLIYSKQIVFKQCEKVVYHLLSIPGYKLIVSEIERSRKEKYNPNIGWLVSSFSKISEEEKELYINKLLGK